MICVTRFNGTRFYLNAELIQSVEGTPDTVITLLNSVKVIVKESPQEVVDKIVVYQQTVRHPQTNLSSGE